MRRLIFKLKQVEEIHNSSQKQNNIKFNLFMDNREK